VTSFVLSLISCTATSIQAAEVVRRPLESGVYALARDGGTVGLEIILPQSSNSQRVLAKYLAVESEWTQYRGRLNSFVPISKLKPAYQRRVLLSVFERDAVDAQGWWHQVVFTSETTWTICALLTGNGSNHGIVAAHPANDGLSSTLHRGDIVLIPFSTLNKSFGEATPDRMIPRAAVTEPNVELAALSDGLRFAADARGSYAIYTLKKGESLYSSVVVRFTDLHDNADILEACQTIAARSSIRDVRDIDAGRSILIPAEMLSARFQPRGTAVRDEYEATLVEAQRLRGDQGRSKDLAGVVVILDPGHGGTDSGARHSRDGLYEDEINYDIVCRIKQLLEQETSARVHLTLIDRSQGVVASNTKRFEPDQDEELMTSPRYPNTGTADNSANLRWMLANALYDREVRAGADSKKIVFTSVHTDMIYNDKIRGTMIYVPGAAYRRNSETRSDAMYAKYAEGRSYNRFTSDSAERKRDEALSRNFADVLIEEIGRARIKRHDNGDPIRNVVVRNRSERWVPAVIRNTKVPTKVLIETANLNNAIDRQRLADPAWRQTFAEAYVDALKRYYGSDVTTRVASRGGGD
jgi:N-acetylmuramoyl-L-alanine amidase